MLETRYYIALSGGMRVMWKLGPGEPDQFTTDPRDPAPFDGGWAYPVSAEIAAEWTRDDNND